MFESRSNSSSLVSILGAAMVDYQPPLRLDTLKTFALLCVKNSSQGKMANILVVKDDEQVRVLVVSIVEESAIGPCRNNAYASSE